MYWIEQTQSLALRIRTYGFFNCYGQLHDHILRPILQPNFDLVQSFTDSLTISNAKKKGTQRVHSNNHTIEHNNISVVNATEMSIMEYCKNCKTTKEHDVVENNVRGSRYMILRCTSCSEKQFQCILCNAVFINKNHDRRYIKKHMREKHGLTGDEINPLGLRTGLMADNISPSLSERDRNDAKK